MDFNIYWTPSHISIYVPYKFQYKPHNDFPKKSKVTFLFFKDNTNFSQIISCFDFSSVKSVL